MYVEKQVNEPRRFFSEGEEDEYYELLRSTEFPITKSIFSTWSIRKKMQASFRPCTADNIPPIERVECKIVKSGQECSSLTLPASLIGMCPYMQFDEQLDCFVIHQPEHGYEFELEKKIVEMLYLPVEILFLPTNLPPTFEDVQFFCKAWQQLDFLGRFSTQDHKTIASTCIDVLHVMAENHFRLLDKDATKNQHWTASWSSILNTLADTGLLKYLVRQMDIVDIAFMCPSQADLLLLGYTATHDSSAYAFKAKGLCKSLVPWFVAQGMFGRDTQLEQFNVEFCLLSSDMGKVTWNGISLFLLWSKTLPLDSFRLSANTDIVKILAGYYLPVQKRFDLCLLLASLFDKGEITWQHQRKADVEKWWYTERETSFVSVLHFTASEYGKTATSTSQWQELGGVWAQSARAWEEESGRSSYDSYCSPPLVFSDQHDQPTLQNLLDVCLVIPQLLVVPTLKQSQKNRLQLCMLRYLKKTLSLGCKTFQQMRKTLEFLCKYTDDELLYSLLEKTRQHVDTLKLLLGNVEFSITSPDIADWLYSILETKQRAAPTSVQIAFMNDASTMWKQWEEDEKERKASSTRTISVKIHLSDLRRLVETLDQPEESWMDAFSFLSIS